jgi:hypothetical protein
MKFIRLDLLTLLISLFIFGSCKNQNDIGLPTDGQQVDGTLMVYDDIVIKTDTDNVTVSSGTIGYTPSKPVGPLASMNDGQFGPTESSVATSLNLPGSAAYTVPTGTITTDSVVMELRYTNGFYGDSLNTKYKLNVYQLKEKLLATQNYYTNKVWTYDNATAFTDPVKSVPFNARPGSRVKIYNILKGAKDTLRTAVPQLRIPLSNSFASTYLFNAPAANLASNAAFQNALNGFFLKLDRSAASQPGGALMLNLDSSRVNVYYRTVNAGVTDTAMVSMLFATHAIQVNQRYVSPSNTTYPTAIKSAIEATTSNNVFYLQGLSGLRAKVSFPNLKTMFGTADVSKVAISRAELVITTVPGSDLPPFTAQPLLTFYMLDITRQRALVPDANATLSSSGVTPLDSRFFSAAAFGGDYISNKREYHFTLTGYIQDLLNGRIKDYGAYLGVADGAARASGVVDISPTIQTAGRVIAVGSDKSSPYRIKLNIIYTKNN